MIAYLTTIVLNAAQTAVVPGWLLLAICTHESSGFTKTYNKFDGGSPSVGICMVKMTTAKMLGFRGTEKDLMNPYANAKWAAEYLKYQLQRYDYNGCKSVASYNAGSFTESQKYHGLPRNVKYVRKIQSLLDEDKKDFLNCRK